MRERPNIYHRINIEPLPQEGTGASLIAVAHDQTFPAMIQWQESKGGSVSMILISIIIIFYLDESVNYYRPNLKHIDSSTTYYRSTSHLSPDCSAQCQFRSFYFPVASQSTRILQMATRTSHSYLPSILRQLLRCHLVYRLSKLPDRCLTFKTSHTSLN